ncbi:HAD hydrolase family protein [Nicoliella spurrieriana]|uniref:HAD hydrolase family protein n=1 Tax=Nicoliella spurrieriana TaxID=2925830 RepID=A0A976RR29_9LACO|nr:HAD hydrolase family protein [Nicoliella spurrieriana]UQS86284.1 HAD hydrolase family protein [Nicoliella spurrieriana]
MKKLLLADLDHGFLSATDQLDKSRLNQQLAALATQGVQMGFMTVLPYAKLIQILRGIQAPVTLICEGGAQTVNDRVVTGDIPIDYDTWTDALQWLQGQRDFNTAYVVLSGKMNAYTDAHDDNSAAQAFSQIYPSLYQMSDLTLVGDTVYQMSLYFANGDLQTLAQTFNSHFNGRLVAVASEHLLWITAFEASYANAIDQLSTELELPDQAVVMLTQQAGTDPIDAIMGTEPVDGYDAIDQWLSK